MHTVVFTGGRLKYGAPVRQALEAADSIIAADSGAAAALDMEITPSVVIGDFDSLNAGKRKILEARGVRLIGFPTEKDKTDTELAIDYAVRHGADLVTVLGGMDGSRIDHVLSNILIMTGCKVPVRFVNDSTTVWHAKGPATERIEGVAGDTVSLLPLTPRADGITTHGLKYGLHDGVLRMDRSRGISNVMTRKQASVTWSRGVLLFVHDANPV
jgi:thiamine pyrophosphokinase